VRRRKRSIGQCTAQGGLPWNLKTLKQLLEPYQAIKDGPVKHRLDFYIDHVKSKRRAAEYSGHTILLLSLIIPLVANHPFKDHWGNGLIVSILSLLIALISGIRESTQWTRLWREYSQAIVEIEALIGAWEIEIAKARSLTDLTKITDILEKATTTLLASVNKIVLAEMGAFFTVIPKTPQAQVQHDEPTAAK